MNFEIFNTFWKWNKKQLLMTRTAIILCGGKGSRLEVLEKNFLKH